MIILDTNVVSEALKPRPDALVIAWLNLQVAETLYLTTVSLSELLLGIQLLPIGKRRQKLAQMLEELLAPLFQDRYLSFDSKAATAYASLIARARSRGQHPSVAGGQIAAIASIHSFSVATRDVAPFEAIGVSILNPWAH